jgi:hypothetical protein
MRDLDSICDLFRPPLFRVVALPSLSLTVQVCVCVVWDAAAVEATQTIMSPMEDHGGSHYASLIEHFVSNLCIWGKVLTKFLQNSFCSVQYLEKRTRVVVSG